MKRKNKNCLYCGDEITEGTMKKKYCNDKCRLNAHRENKRLHEKLKTFQNEAPKGIYIDVTTMQATWIKKD